MNKKLYTLCAIAAAFVLAGCQKENNEEATTYVGPTHTVTFTAEKMIDTKTAIDTEGNGVVSYKWIEGDEERMEILEFYTGEKDGEIVTKTNTGTITGMTLSNNGRSATFTAEFSGEEAPETLLYYQAAYAGAFSNNHNPKIPAAQSPLPATFDPAADVLVSDTFDGGRSATSFIFNMTRKASVNKMTLKGLTPGEVISTVTFESDKQHAATYSLLNNSYSGDGKKLTFTFTANNTVPANGEFPVYFTTAPVENATFTVSVTTDQNKYRKTSSKTITLATGSVRRFGVDLSGSVVPDGRAFTLVEDVSNLVIGSDVVIATNGSNDIAMSTTQNENNRGETEATKSGTGYTTIMVTDAVQIFTLTNGTTSGTYAFRCNNGGSLAGQYIYAASSSKNWLRTQANLDANASWTIKISNKEATITAQGENTRNVLQYNASSSIFACYASASQQNVYLYQATGLPASELSFTNDSYTFTLGDSDYTSFTGQSLNNPNSISDITWTSSNTSLATVSDGDITWVPNATGTTTITATFAGDDFFGAGSASYTITVNPAAGHGESAEDPFSVSEVLTFVNGLSSTPTTDEYYVSGIISRIANNGEFSTSFGNATFYISDDGSSSSDEFEAYRVLYLGNRKWQNGDMQIAVGDEVVVCGRLTVYNTQVETLAQTGENAYNGYLVSLEKAPYFNATLSSDSIAAEGGDITLSIDSNTSWTVTVTGSASLSANSGSNSDSVTITIPQNNNGTTYTLSFTATGVSPTPEDLVITQNAYVNLVSATATFTGKKSGGMTGVQAEQIGVRRNVTATVSSGLADTSNDHIRVYKNNTLTLSVPSGAYITGIEFIGVSGNPVSGFGNVVGLTTSGNDGSWSGYAQSVTFTASVAQVRLAKILVTYSIDEEDLAYDTPVIDVTSDNPMSLSNTSGSASITYIIEDAPDGAVLTSVTKNASWITNVNYSTSGSVTFDFAAQAIGAAARSTILVLKYTGATDVTVTVDQAAGPSSSGTQDYTTVWTASSGALGTGIGSGTISTTVSGSSSTQSWDYTRTLISGSSYTGWGNNCIQVGKNGGVENLTLTTSNIPGTIKSVSVECASYQGKHNVSITVGGNTYLASTATPTWSNNSTGTKTGTGTSSGNITISFTGGTRALYIKSVTVVYNN